MRNNSEEEKVNVNEVLAVPEIKLLKLVNGESIIAMIEFVEQDDPEAATLITLYNPFRLIFGEISALQRSAVMMEEWLPAQIVQEQMCQILYDDVLTIVNVNDKFARSYTASVLRKVQLDELARVAPTLGGNKVAEDMALAEEEAQEIDEEEMKEQIEEWAKKFRGSFN